MWDFLFTRRGGSLKLKDLNTLAELGYGLAYKDAAVKLLDMKAASELIRRNRGKTVLVARGKHIAKWVSLLPAPVFQADNGPKGYVYWRF